MLAPAVSHALELGRLTVYSTLNAPLDADIELTSISRNELNSLVARIASPAEFESAGIEIEPVVSEIAVTVVKRSSAQYFLQLRSRQPLSEPFLQFVLEATWSGGRVVREFAALIDPSEAAETVAEEEPSVPTLAPNLDTERVPQHEQPVVSRQHQGLVVLEQIPAQVIAFPPHAVVQVTPPQKSEEPTSTSEPATFVPSSKQDDPHENTGLEGSSAKSEKRFPAGAPRPAPPVQAQARRSKLQATARETTTSVAKQVELPKQPPVGASVIDAAAHPKIVMDSTERLTQSPVPKQQSALNMLTEIVRENPGVVLIVAICVVGALLLMVTALVVLALKRRRYNAYVDFDEKITTINSKPPTNEKHAEPPRRQIDKSTTGQNGRVTPDRRQRSVPVAFERRSGLSRRRSELIDGGVPTVAADALDPIAEADVYLACGSYEHAEETLQDAIAKDPCNNELKVKLLEIYHQCGNTLAFNALSEELSGASEEGSGELPERSLPNRWLLNYESVPPDELLAANEAEPDDAVPNSEALKRSNGSSRPDWSADAAFYETDEDSIAPQTVEEPRQHWESPAANTLNKAFTDFLEARKTLKPRTVDGYQKMMAVAFADWRPKSLLEISQEMVSNRHQELCEEHGKAYANRAMRFLRTLYNFAQKRYQDTSSKPLLTENPVKSLTANRA